MTDQQKNAIRGSAQPEAIDAFAGVGHFFHLADLQACEQVVDLGSGSGMDTFVASLKVGPRGRVVGLDMTDAQLSKAAHLARSGQFENVTYRRACIEDTGLDAGTFDCVISNGVINLAIDKVKVFEEAARLLRHGGRLAISGIVTELPLPEGVACNADLWAACIGGAAQKDEYAAAIDAAGLRVEPWRRTSSAGSSRQVLVEPPRNGAIHSVVRRSGR